MQIWQSFEKYNSRNTSSNNNPLIFLWPGCFCTKDKRAALLRLHRSLCDPKQKVTVSWTSKQQLSLLVPCQIDGLFRISHLPGPRPVKAWVHFLAYQESQLRSISWSAAVTLPTEVAETISEPGRSRVTKGFMGKGSLGAPSALVGVGTGLPSGENYHARWDPSLGDFRRLFIAVAPQALHLNSTVLNSQ